MFQVICTAHSKLSFDGKPLAKDGKEYMAVIAKDGKQKGFFLRLVDKEVSSYHFYRSIIMYSMLHRRNV